MLFQFCVYTVCASIFPPKPSRPGRVGPVWSPRRMWQLWEEQSHIMGGRNILSLPSRTVQCMFIEKSGAGVHFFLIIVHWLFTKHAPPRRSRISEKGICGIREMNKGEQKSIREQSEKRAQSGVRWRGSLFHLLNSVQ